MARRMSTKGSFPSKESRRVAYAAAIAVAVTLAVTAGATPAFAQFGGGFGGDRSFSPGPFTARPGRGGGGPVWGGARPFYPGPSRLPPWIEPRPRFVEDDDDDRPRRPPMRVDREPRREAPREPGRPPRAKPDRDARAAPQARPPTKAKARQAAAPPVRAMTERVRTLPVRAPRPNSAPQQQLPDEVVVELKPGAPPAAAGAIARDYGLTAVSAQPVSLLDTVLHRYRIRNGRPVDAVVRSLAGDVRVASAQPNFIFRLQAEAAGAMASLQYARAKLRLPEAQEMTTGRGVVVAVIDSGVDATHPEITEAVEGSLHAQGVGPKPDPHGTAVAGIIAARAQLVGAAPGARVLAIQAFAADRKAGEMRGVSTDVVGAISLGAEAGVRLVNLSFAGPADPLLARALAAAGRRGAIFVASAGNGGPKSPPVYPAADRNVIAVTATDGKDALFPAANRGAFIAVAAPGVDILVAAPGGRYKLASGTSMAAAHVSGILALVLQMRPDLTLEQARAVLADTARDLGPAGIDPDFGSGLVDARRSVERAAEESRPPVPQVATIQEAP